MKAAPLFLALVVGDSIWPGQGFLSIAPLRRRGTTACSTPRRSTHQTFGAASSSALRERLSNEQESDLCDLYIESAPYADGTKVASALELGIKQFRKQSRSIFLELLDWIGIRQEAYITPS